MLAIVIPYYKIKYFEKTLDSLEAQTDKRFRVYIGDDASPENPEIIVKRFDKLSITYKRFKENLGAHALVKQWDRCIALVKDEPWIMVLGDDDVLGANCVEMFYNHLAQIEQKSIQVVRYASQVINEKGSAISSVYEHPVIEKATYSFYRKFRKYTRSSLSEHVFKKEAYLKNGFKNFPLAWYSDDLAWLEFSNFGNVYTINEALVRIRFTAGSISGKQDNLAAKQEARFQYLSTLIFEYISYFSAKQCEAILNEYDLIKNNFDKHVWYANIWISYQRLIIFLSKNTNKLKVNLKKVLNI